MKNWNSSNIFLLFSLGALAIVVQLVQQILLQ